MHFAYLDDSGSDAESPILVYGGIVVPDQRFRVLEGYLATRILQCVPAEQRSLLPEFPEFHAAELFHGTGQFKDIPKDVRVSVLQELLEVPSKLDLHYVYSAVKKKSLAERAFGSAHPVDVGFRMCVQWIDRTDPPVYSTRGEDEEPVCVIVVDDGDKQVKQILQRSFRVLRGKPRRSATTGGGRTERLRNLHEDIYFADSKYSSGIQVADACNYIMLRHLRDGIEDELYKTLMETPNLECARSEPDWSANPDMFLSLGP